jgi:hypothetical protein
MIRLLMYPKVTPNLGATVTSSSGSCYYRSGSLEIEGYSVGDVRCSNI